MSLWCSSGAAAVIRQVTCADDDADCDQEDTQAEEGEDDAESDCSGQGEDGKAMSLGRATGLAKLPSVLEWLRCHAVQPVLASCRPEQAEMAEIALPSCADLF